MHITLHGNLNRGEIICDTNDQTIGQAGVIAYVKCTDPTKVIIIPANKNAAELAKHNDPGMLISSNYFNLIIVKSELKPHKRYIWNWMMQE